MEQNSRIIYNNFNNSQDLFFPDNDYNYNSFLLKDLWNNTNGNTQSSPTILNNNLWNPLNANNYPDSLSNHSLLSKKIKRDKDKDSENAFKNDKIKSDLEEEEEKGRKKNISDWVNQSFDSILDNFNESLIFYRIYNPTEKEVKEIIKCFLLAFTTIKDLNKFLNTSWRDILSKYDSSLIYTLSDELLETCPKDYIEEILNEEKAQKELIPINLQELKNIIELKMKGNRKIKNSKASLLSDFNDIHLEIRSFYSWDFNTNFESNKNNVIKLDEVKETKNESTKTIETNIENRIDNLFDRFKSMINKSFIDMFNTKVKEENKLPEEINNYLIKIRGKEDNIKFLENNFRDNFTFFGKNSAQYQIILETIGRIYQNQAQNAEAVELLEKPTQNFIHEIMRNEEMRRKFFDEDKEMKIKEVKNDKCKIIAHKIKDQEDLKGYIKINKSKNEKNYIVIKDVEKFIKRINKIKGYENYDLGFTNNENEKIDERTLILENIADNPMLYLKLIKGRLPRNEVKKGKKIEKKILFSVKK